MRATPDITGAFEERGPGTQPRGEIDDAWRSACEDARSAYRFWCDAGDERKADAYIVYVAALDREEAAAQHLRSGSVAAS